MSSTTDDIRIQDQKALVSPVQLMQEIPLSETAEATVTRARQAVRDILDGRDDRLVVVVGPCSIHDPDAAMEYANLLNAARQEHEQQLAIIMRVYFEKPRTTIGWKGLINDPDMDNSFHINRGTACCPFTAGRHQRARPAGRRRVSRSDQPAVHRRSGRLGRNWRTYHRIPGPSGTGIGAVLSCWLQERYCRQRADRGGCDRGCAVTRIIFCR